MMSALISGDRSITCSKNKACCDHQDHRDSNNLTTRETFHSHLRIKIQKQFECNRGCDHISDNDNIEKATGEISNSRP